MSTRIVRIATVAIVTIVALGAPRANAATAAGAKASTRATAAKKMAVPFIEDDFAKALAEAKARKVPIFIEAWAPW